jgi:hypothetical protein
MSDSLDAALDALFEPTSNSDLIRRFKEDLIPQLVAPDVELLPKHLKCTALFLAAARLHANKSYRKLAARVIQKLASTEKLPGFLVAAIQSVASDCARSPSFLYKRYL